jgi:hypothetical protein
MIMSTFVVRFVGDPSRVFRGRVRHIATGEEKGFAGIRELVAFFEEMNAIQGSFDDLVENSRTSRRYAENPADMTDSRPPGSSDTSGRSNNV